MGGLFGGGGNQQALNQSRGNLFSVFNYGMPAAQGVQAAGTGTLNTALSTLGPAASYFKSLLAPGRATATANAAPAINTALDQQTATRNQAAALGTGRTGGATAIQREAGATTQKSIDDIINQSLMTGRATGAAGLGSVAGTEAGIGGTQLSDAANLLSTASGGQQSVMQTSEQAIAAQDALWGSIAEGLGMGAGGLLSNPKIF